MHHNTILGGHITGALIANTNPGILAQETRAYQRPSIKTVFSGKIEVEQVNNGYVVKIGQRQGDLYDCYVAKDAKEVNELITAAVVTFRLENT